MGPERLVNGTTLFSMVKNIEYELWEVKLLAYMRLKKLHEVINPTLPNAARVDDVKNAEAFAELVQFFDNRSLGLMRDANNNGREALKILRTHYASSGKPRIISLYTQLTSLRKSVNESITDYIIRPETSATSLKGAGEYQ